MLSQFTAETKPARYADADFIAIDQSLFKPSEKEVVEDLIVAAIRDAQEKSGDRAKEEMAKATAGLNLPEGFKLPF